MHSTVAALWRSCCRRSRSSCGGGCGYGCHRRAAAAAAAAGGTTTMTTTGTTTGVVAPFSYSSYSTSFSSFPSSGDGTREFFGWLERARGARFDLSGRRPLPMNGGAGVVTRDELRAEDLRALLVGHGIAALRVRGFFPPSEASALGAELERNELRSSRNWKVGTNMNNTNNRDHRDDTNHRGLESSDVATTGQHLPHNIAAATGRLDEYHDGVKRELRHRRGLLPSASASSVSSSTTRLWPLDLLRLELDEVWPAGAGLARSARDPGLHHGGGLVRMMTGPTRWKKGLVHVDDLNLLSDTRGVFGANIYLQLPNIINNGNNGNGNNTNDDNNNNNKDYDDEEQPVMEVWPLDIRSKWDWYRVR